MSAFLILTAVLFFAVSCGGGFEAFETLPDADLTDEVYTDMVLRFSRYSYINQYLMMRYVNEHRAQKDGVYYDMNSAGAVFYAGIYDDWKVRYPEKIEYIEDSFDNLLTMTLTFKYADRVEHFESMKKTVENYVRYVYMGVEPDDGTEIEDYVSENFLAKNPRGIAEKYLNGNRIHVKDIKFSQVFTAFEQHNYPFKITHKFEIFYYTGDIEPSEKKLDSRKLSVCYFLSSEDGYNYKVEYVNDQRYFTEQLEEGEMMLKEAIALAESQD